MKAFMVEMENRPGEFARVAEAVAAKGINITAISGASCGDSGCVAMMTSDDAKTRMALDEADTDYEEAEAVEASLRNEPGMLAGVARRLADAGVNLEALMATGMRGDEVSVAFVTDNATKAREVLGAATGAQR